jgi:hypothetical protein
MQSLLLIQKLYDLSILKMVKKGASRMLAPIFKIIVALAHHLQTSRQLQQE